MKESIIFQRLDVVTTTDARWLVTFAINLKPFGDFLEKLTMTLNESSITIGALNLRYNVSKTASFGTIVNGLKTELSDLRTIHSDIIRTFDDIRTLRKRQKRSLLPIVGKALSFLFGTVSEDDLNSIKQGVNHLANNQKKISHIVEKTLTVLDTTRLEVSENRQAIDGLIVALSNVSIQLQQMNEEIRRDIVKLRFFVTTYAQIDIHLSELTRITNAARFQLEKLMSQFSILSLGHLSPATISPSNLRTLLMDIKRQLPATLYLTHDPVFDLWTYYRFLTCATVVDGSKAYIIVSLPLVNINDKFELYKVHNLPSVTPKTNELLSKTQYDIAAAYELESNYFAINPERTKFLFLSETDVQTCTSQALKFCGLRNPIYPINLSKFCLTTLFIGDKANIHKNCKTVVYPNALFPRAEYIADGSYVVSTRNAITFNQVCKHSASTKSQTLQPPLDVITLDKFCFASSNEIYLPGYFHKESRYEVTNQIETLIKNFNATSLKIWEPLTSVLPSIKLPALPKQLKKIDKISMDKFIDTLQNLDTNIESVDSFPNWAGAVISLAAALALGILIYLCCKYKKKGCNFRRRFNRRGRVEQPDVSQNVEMVQLMTQRELPQPSAPNNMHEEPKNNTNKSVYPVLELAK